MFTKEYFEETLDEVTNSLRAMYKCSELSVTLIAQGRNYDIVSLVRLDPEILLFAYRTDEKIAEVVKARKEEVKKPVAWPVAAIPYMLIELIEFKPVEQKSSFNIGFKQSGDVYGS